MATVAKSVSKCLCGQQDGSMEFVYQNNVDSSIALPPRHNGILESVTEKPGACVVQVSIHRVVIISEEGPDTCRHTITGDVTVRVPAIGRMVEKYVMTNTVAAMSMLGTVVDR